MAISMPDKQYQELSKLRQSKQRNTYGLFALTSLFFIWGVITSLNDILIPHFKQVFELSYTQAMLVQSCFFGAYFIVSLPAGKLVGKVGYQLGIVAGLLIAGIGCVLFLPASIMISYQFFLIALFILAAGITILQVAANPYVTALGSPESASGRLTMTQAFNSLGTTLAPFFGAVLILDTANVFSEGDSSFSEKATALGAVQLPYLLLAGCLLLLSFLFYKINLPKITEHSRYDSDSNEPVKSILSYRGLVLGSIGIFLYVGAEVSIGSFLINFISEPKIGNMSEAAAGKLVAYYWGGAMVGRFLGAIVMQFVKPSLCLAFNAICSAILILVAINSSGQTAVMAILLVGFFNSIMFPTIFSLALRGLKQRTSQGSGLLCLAIVGGAIIPLIQGIFADLLSVQSSFFIPLVSYLYIIYLGLSQSKKIITN